MKPFNETTAVFTEILHLESDMGNGWRLCIDIYFKGS